jgi:hypothetical protein
VCSTHWSDLLTEGVSRNPKLSAAEKAAEIARAVRRTESFVEIMLPPVDAAGRMINCAAQADSAAPATDRRATAHAHPLPPVHGAAPGSASSAGLPSTLPAFAGSSGAATGGPSSSAGPVPTGRRPVSDPRRNSMMLLKKFVSANSKPKQQQQGLGQPAQAQPAPVANGNGNGLVAHGPHGGVPLPALSGSAGGSQAGVVRHYSVQPSRSSAAR